MIKGHDISKEALSIIAAHNPDGEDDIVLRFKKIWKNSNILQAQLAMFTQEECKKLTKPLKKEKPEWEVYARNEYEKLYQDNADIRLESKRIQDAISETYNVKITPDIIKKLDGIRRSAAAWWRRAEEIIFGKKVGKNAQVNLQRN